VKQAGWDASTQAKGDFGQCARLYRWQGSIKTGG